jgi:hypothetical protein
MQESFASAIFLAKLILFDFDKYRDLVGPVFGSDL